MRSEFENKSDGYMRAFLDNRLQTIRAASEEAAEATPEEVPARRARGRHASEQARLRFLAKIDRLRHSVLSARARNVPSDASAAEAELKPQQLFEFDADSHDEASGAQPSPAYRNGHWLLKHVAGDPDAEFPGEITIEHLVEHTVCSLHTAIVGFPVHSRFCLVLYFCRKLYCTFVELVDAAFLYHVLFLYMNEIYIVIL